METAVDAIVTVDEAGIIRSFNRAAVRLFGYAPSHAIGQPISLLMPEPHRSHHQRYIERYLATGTANIIGVGREVQAQRKDGTLVPVYLAVSEFEVSGGRRFAGVLHDISADHEARELRRRLAHAAELSAMAEMTAALAHEINQPLAAIATYAEAARGQAGAVGDAGSAQAGNAELARTLDKVVAQSRRASAVVERVQGLVRGLSDAAPNTDFQRADINALIAEVVSLAQIDAQARGVEVVFAPAPALPDVWCDPVQIQQVGLNLIRNAIDAIAETNHRDGRVVDVRTRLDGGTVQTSVTDCGAGVPEHQRDAVFMPFHSSKPGGMGMGLSVCRTILANHGGTLAHRNNTPQAGATFYFALPVANDG